MATSKSMEEIERDHPVGSQVIDYVHAPDGGTLYVTGYGTIHSIYIVVMRCAKCGQGGLDVSDYEAIEPRKIGEG